MTPDVFLAEVVRPNMEAALQAPGDTQAIVNAILSIDALAGILHTDLCARGRSHLPLFEDDRYRDELASVSISFRVLRDAAASIKHGALSPVRKKVRLLRGPDAIANVPNVCGLFQCGDALGSHVIVIEFDPGPGFVRASSAIANSYRMLARIVHGGEPQTDEHDRGAFLLTANSNADQDHPKPTGPATDAVKRMDVEIAADRARGKG